VGTGASHEDFSGQLNHDTQKNTTLRKYNKNLIFLNQYFSYKTLNGFSIRMLILKKAVSM